MNRILKHADFPIGASRIVVGGACRETARNVLGIFDAALCTVPLRIAIVITYKHYVQSSGRGKSQPDTSTSCLRHDIDEVINKLEFHTKTLVYTYEKKYKVVSPVAHRQKISLVI